MSDNITKQKWSAPVPIGVGVFSILALIGTLGVWGTQTEIAGAVIAPGVVEVEFDRQVVQHLDGGVVGEIFARSGDDVSVGDLVLRLDDTYLLSELAIVENQLAETKARLARLTAERDDTEFGISLVEQFPRLNEEWIAALINGQQNLYTARKSAFASELEQLDEQQTQMHNRTKGLAIQAASLARQKGLSQTELNNQKTLLGGGLTLASRVLDLEQSVARLEGEIGALDVTIAETKGSIAQLEISKLQLRTARREEAITDLRDMRVSEAELGEQRLALETQLARLDIRSPASGRVFDSQVSTVGAVVGGGAPLMYVVPDDQPFRISARVDPVHIEQIRPGQEVKLRLSSFDQRITPEITGDVLRVAADTTTDEVTGERFYEATVRPSKFELAALPHIELLPGMPIEAFLRTSDRTPIAYLTQPLADYFTRAFRE